MKSYIKNAIKTLFKEENLFFVVSLSVLIIGCAAILGIKIFARPVVVSGHSMDPTYYNGEILTTRPLAKGEIPATGSVITFKRDDGKNLIKRVMAVPGDTILIDNGVLYRNGEAVEDGFPAMEDPGWVFYTETVPEGCVFVLGDNRNASSDSRSIGWVYIENIFGVVTGHLR